jgi:hypothetical protein
MGRFIAGIFGGKMEGPKKYLIWRLLHFWQKPQIRWKNARRRERRTMDEYITPNYKTIGTVEQRKIRELYTSSLLNAFTQQDYLDAIALMGRVIDRLEELEK